MLAATEVKMNERKQIYFFSDVSTAAVLVVA